MYKFGSSNVQSTAVRTAAVPNLVPFIDNYRKQLVKYYSSVQLIKHPDNFPIHVRQLPWWQSYLGRVLARHTDAPKVELQFFSGGGVRVGTSIEVAIPVRRDTYRFNCRVQSMAETALGYRIRVSLNNPEDGARVGLVERVCWLECQLKARIFAKRQLRALAR